jgi:hypothetical protein
MGGARIIKPLPYYRQGHRIYFLHGGSRGADSVTPNNWVIMKVTAARAELKVKVASEPWKVGGWYSSHSLSFIFGRIESFNL